VSLLPPANPPLFASRSRRLAGFGATLLWAPRWTFALLSLRLLLARGCYLSIDEQSIAFALTFFAHDATA
jgi:hypothetical protein